MLDPEVLAVLQLAPVDYDAFCSDPANRDSLQRLESALEGLATRAVRLASYMGQRHGYGMGEQGHAKAVKYSNKAVRLTRRAIGYNNTLDLTY